MHSPKKVLIVEDDLCLETTFSRVLQLIDPRIVVDWAMSAEEAFARMRDHPGESFAEPYDLVVADIYLEGRTTGLDLFQSLDFSHSSFLITSGMPIDRFLRLLGDDVICPPFLPKPFSVHQCRQLLQELLGYPKAA